MNTNKTINSASLKLMKGFALFFYFFSLNSNIGFSQGSFYLKPLVQSKIFMAAQVAPEDYYADKRYPLIRQGIYNPYVFSQSHQTMRSLSFELGLAFGWISADKRRMMEVVWQGDPVGFKTTTYSRELSDPNYFILAPQSSRNVRHLGFNYAFQFKKNPAFMITRFSVGTGVLINFNSNTDVVVKWNYNYLLEPNVELKSIYFQPFIAKRVRPFIAIGIESDFKIRQKYIASLKVNIVQGFGIIDRIEVVHEYEINGENYLSEIGLISRGSGISVQLSRRFQIHPWKKWRKEE